MMPIIPVFVPRAALAFCRIFTALLVWLTVFTGRPHFLGAAGAIFLWSAGSRIGRAPLIVLYRQTIERIRPSVAVMLDENAMCFAHILGTVLTVICLGVFLMAGSAAGRFATLWLALAKSVGALGFCPAAKLYTCITSEGCCRLTRRKNG